MRIDETVKTEKTSDDRIVWFDVARLVAMFTLLCCHCANPFNWVPADSPVAGEVKLWGGIYGAMLRHSVPFFVMLTGALLLPVRQDAASFYKKKDLPGALAVSNLVRNLLPCALAFGCSGVRQRCRAFILSIRRQGFPHTITWRIAQTYRIASV